MIPGEASGGRNVNGGMDGVIGGRPCGVLALVAL